MLPYAPGSRAEIRNEEWLIRRVDPVLKPAMVAHRVEGSVENKVNLGEAEEIVNLICAYVDLPEYKDKSIGVICMVGDKQTDKISNMLRARLDPAVYD
jgi:hypothetical protein